MRRLGIVRPPRGLTLIELLVVFVIVAMLAALLLPAIQLVREAARRRQCQNNMRQIGIALQMHVNSKRDFPAGWLADGSGKPGWAWAAAVLSYIDEKNLADQFKFTQPADDPSLASVRTTVIPTFMCPSDLSPEIVAAESLPFNVARSNYAGMYGSTAVSPPYVGNGVFFRNRPIRPLQISDGLSKTILVGERSSRLGSCTWVAVLGSQNVAAASVVGAARHAPNDLLGNFADFSSFHNSITQFLMGDCSVRPIADEIDRRVFKALATRAGNELISDENGVFTTGSTEDDSENGDEEEEDDD